MKRTPLQMPELTAEILENIKRMPVSRRLALIERWNRNVKKIRKATGDESLGQLLYFGNENAV